MSLLSQSPVHRARFGHFDRAPFGHFMTCYEKTISFTFPTQHIDELRIKLHFGFCGWLHEYISIARLWMRANIKHPSTVIIMVWLRMNLRLSVDELVEFVPYIYVPPRLFIIVPRRIMYGTITPPRIWHSFLQWLGCLYLSSPAGHNSSTIREGKMAAEIISWSLSRLLQNIGP